MLIERLCPWMSSCFYEGSSHATSLHRGNAQSCVGPAGHHLCEHKHPQDRGLSLKWLAEFFLSKSSTVRKTSGGGTKFTTFKKIIVLIYCILCARNFTEVKARHLRSVSQSTLEGPAVIYQVQSWTQAQVGNSKNWIRGTQCHLAPGPQARRELRRPNFNACDLLKT